MTDAREVVVTADGPVLITGLPRTGTVDARAWRELQRAQIPRARYPGDHVEVSKGRQERRAIRALPARHSGSWPRSPRPPHARPMK